jgi:transcriptional regulator with XRE-family HTH domain
MTKSNRRFRETVLALLEMEDISQRELVRRGERRSKSPRSMGALNPVLQKGVEPSIGLIEFVAEALMIEPETFAEYRMWQARRMFDPSDEEMGGFDAAITNLRALEQLGAEADLPLPAGLIADRQAARGNGPKRAESA